MSIFRIPSNGTTCLCEEELLGKSLTGTTLAFLGVKGAILFVAGTELVLLELVLGLGGLRCLLLVLDGGAEETANHGD